MDGDVILVGDCAKAAAGALSRTRSIGAVPRSIPTARPSGRTSRTRDRALRPAAARSSGRLQRVRAFRRHRRSGAPADALAADDSAAAGHSEAARDQGFRHPHSDSGAVPRRGRQGPARGRRVLRDHSAGGAVLRRLHRSSMSRIRRAPGRTCSCSARATRWRRWLPSTRSWATSIASCCGTRARTTAF